MCVYGDNTEDTGGIEDKRKMCLVILWCRFILKRGEKEKKGRENKGKN